jgi:hypothetical protein
MHGFENGMRPGFGRGFDDAGPRMIGRGSFGFFPFFGFLWQLLVLGVVIWLVYKFVKGWRLNLTPPASAANPVPPPATEETSNTGN